jgi:hypothetical protein
MIVEYGLVRRKERAYIYARVGEGVDRDFATFGTRVKMRAVCAGGERMSHKRCE